MRTKKTIFQTWLAIIALGLCTNFAFAKEPRSSSKKVVQQIEAKTAAPKTAAATPKPEVKVETPSADSGSKSFKGYYEHKAYTLHIWDNPFSKEDSGGLQKILISMRIDRATSQEDMCYFLTSTDEFGNPQRVTISDIEKNSCALEIDVSGKSAKVKTSGEECAKLCKNPKTFTDIPTLNLSPEN